MTLDEFDRPVKTEVFHRLSLRRRITNNVATGFFLVSFIVALVPLLWGFRLISRCDGGGC